MECETKTVLGSYILIGEVENTTDVCHCKDNAKQRYILKIQVIKPR